MSSRSDPIALAERDVAEARQAAFAEYEAAQARARRLVISPVFVGGVLLGAAALGYLAYRRVRSKRRADPAGPDAWTLAINTGQIMVPLLVAFVSAITAARRAGGDRKGVGR